VKGEFTDRPVYSVDCIRDDANFELWKNRCVAATFKSRIQLTEKWHEE